MTRRRSFLATAAGTGAFAVLGDLGFLRKLARGLRRGGGLEPDRVRFHPDIEPLVRLLEDTPRERVLEEVGRADQARTELSRGARRAAAGRRAQHPAAAGGLQVPRGARRELGAPRQPRLAGQRPLAADLLGDRSVQVARRPANVKEGNWTMAPVDESAVPPSHRARQMFIEAMDNWDEAPRMRRSWASRARRARMSCSRFSRRYGARDFRDIGHKAIYVANSFRTLEAIGWQHAEPVLRSLAYALLDRSGAKENPAKADLPADRPFRQNLEIGEGDPRPAGSTANRTRRRRRTCSRPSAPAPPRTPAR